MSGPNFPPDINRRLEQIEADIQNLYRMRDSAEDPRDNQEIVFTLAGKLTASTSPRFYFSPAGVVRTVSVSVATPGTGLLRVEMLRNDVVIATLDLPAGMTRTRVSFADRGVAPPTFSSDADHLRFRLTATGGATDLTIQARYTTNRPWKIETHG